ncbi:MAG: hypothetical protein ACRCXB_05515 [Aeromonadaceae bacterium]
MRKLLLALLGITALAHAESQPGLEPLHEGWIYTHSGDEYRYSQGDNSMRFSLICNRHKAATMELRYVARNQWVTKTTSFTFNIDGKPYSDVINFANPDVAQRFPWFLKALRNANNIGVDNFTLININANLLPDPDSPDNPCTIGTQTPSDEPSGPVTDNPQFKVNVPRFEPGYRPESVKSIVLTSLNDNVKIEQVVGNRGQCILAQYGQINGLPAPKLPLSMRYGESVAFPVLLRSKNCNEIYEIEVMTSNGNVTYTQQSN